MTSKNFKQSMVNQDQEIIFEVVKVSGSWVFPAASSIVEATRGKNMYLRLTDDGESGIFRLDYVKDGENAGETVFGFVGNGGMDLVELTSTTDGTGATTGSWDYEPGEGPAGKSNKIAVFECIYSQEAQGYVYPAYGELNTARLAGKLPVIVEISPVGGRTYYVATQMSAYQNNVKFYFVNSESGAMLKLEGPTSNPVWSTGSARGPRYTTRTETATTLPVTINVNDAESILYNVNRVGSGAITIAAPAGTTDAQVAIISTGSSFYINTSNLSVTVGGVSIPVFDLMLPAYGLNSEVEYGILKSNYEPECSIEVPPSFDEVGLVYQVLTDAKINKTAKTTNKMVVQIVGQVALLFAEAKLEAVKDLVADETSLTLTETSNEFTLAIKDGGVSHEKLESTFMFWDPNYAENYAHPKSETTLTSYCTNNCDGKPASIVFLEGITSFTLSNGLMINSERAYKNGSVVLVYNDDDTNTLDVYHDPGSALPLILIDSIPPNKCKLFVCLISLPLGVSQWKSIS